MYLDLISSLISVSYVLLTLFAMAYFLSGNSKKAWTFFAASLFILAIWYSSLNSTFGMIICLILYGLIRRYKIYGKE